MIAVAGGAGKVGKVTVEALRSAGYNVTILARAESISKAPSGPGITVKAVDYASKQSLVDALKGAYGVVSLLNLAGLQSQTSLADAALEAGVSRFIPSEFGSNTLEPHVNALPVFAPKVKTFEHVKALTAANPSFSYTVIMTGLLLEVGFEFPILLDIKNRKILRINDGNDYLSTTSIPETAKAIVGVFDNFEATKNQVIYTQSARITQNQILHMAERLTGSKWSVETSTTDEQLALSQKEMQKKEPSFEVFFLASVMYALFNNFGGSDSIGKVGNDLVGLKPISENDIEEVLKQYLRVLS